jgi:hypothetical protein
MKSLAERMLAVAKEHDIVCIMPSIPKGGVKVGDLMIWGGQFAPSREHRSNMVLNMVMNKSRQDGTTIVYHDLEMSFDEVAAKMMGLYTDPKT